MMLESDQELVDTKQFKVDVEQEAEEAQGSFSVMIEDIESVLFEDGIIELERLLEAHAEAEKKACEQACHEDCQGCSSELKEDCEKECRSSCASCPGCNIFEGLEEEPKK